MRPLLEYPSIPAGKHAAEAGIFFPHGEVPLLLDYADWVERNWPGDIAELMGGQMYDGSSAKALTLYRLLMAKRAYEIRVLKNPVGSVAYAPGSFADVDPNIPTISYVAGKDAAGNDLAVITKSEAPTGGYFLNALGNLTSEEAKGAIADAYGIDSGASWLSLPGELVAKILKPLLWVGVVAALVFLAFKLPDFSGVKVRANIGGGKKKGAK